MQENSVHSFEVALEENFDFSGADYRCLFNAADAEAFAHPVWLEAFYRKLAPSRGARPVIVTGRSAKGSLVFVLPLILRRKQGVRLLEAADLGVSDYAGPVIHPDALETVRCDRHTRQRVKDVLPAHDILRLQPVRPAMVENWRLLLSAEPVPLDFSAHAADLSSPYDLWRKEHFSPSFQKYVNRRKNRLLKNQAVALTKLRGQAAADALYQLREMRTGRFAGDPIQERTVADFYAEVAAAGTDAGFCEVYRLSEADRAIAFVFALKHDGRMLYLLIGCDYDNFGQYSPGIVVYDLMMEDWVDNDGRIFDFTIGDEAFKADFGTKPTPMWALLGTPTAIGKSAQLIFEMRKRYRSLRAGWSERRLLAAKGGGENE